MENKVRKLERWKEIEERERRRRNVVMKRLEVKERRIRKSVRELWKEMQGADRDRRGEGDQ